MPEDEGIDAAIGELASAIAALSGPAAEQWSSLQHRVLDVGLTNRPDKAVCRFEVSPDSLAAMGGLRITLVLSWYWPQAAYQNDEAPEE